MIRSTHHFSVEELSPTIELLHDRALKEPDEQFREWAIEQLKKLEGGD